MWDLLLQQRARNQLFFKISKLVINKEIHREDYNNKLPAPIPPSFKRQPESRLNNLLSERIIVRKNTKSAGKHYESLDEKFNKLMNFDIWAQLKNIERKLYKPNNKMVKFEL